MAHHSVERRQQLQNFEVLAGRVTAVAADAAAAAVVEAVAAAARQHDC